MDFKPTFTAVSLSVLLLVCGCSKKDEPAAPQSSGDPRLEGTYDLIETETRGIRKQEDPVILTYTITANKLVSHAGKLEEAATLQCDPSRTPAEINISKKEANGVTDSTFGIYKIENDLLTICQVKSNNPADRPKEFKTSPASNALIWVLKKKKS